MEPAADSVAGQTQPPAGRLGRARRPRLAGPSDQALHWLAGWYAMALRLGGAVLFTAVAVLAATRQTSGWWLAVPLGALCLWSAFFTWRVRRSGLAPIVVLADAAVISALALAQQHLVPAVLIMDNTTWMLPLACTSVYILQIALRPWLGVPAAGVVIIAYGIGTGRLTGGWLLVAETIVAAGLVAVIRGGARQADAIVAAGLEIERQVRAEEARRADEREQHRQLHDTILSTLTMVAAGAFAGPSPALTAQADRDLRVLRGLAAAPAAPDKPASLTDLRPKLEQATASTHDLAVRLELVPVTLPSPVIDQLVASVGEALRNVERHAGTGQAEVTVTGGAGWAVVKVTDHGRGFDPAATPPSRRGISESITERMRAAGRPGGGRQQSWRGHDRHRKLAGMSAAQPTATMSGRYQRSFTLAVIFLVAVWHLAGAGGQLLHNRPDYGSFAFQCAMWLIMALAITAGSVLVLRGSPGWRSAWAVALIALAASTAAAVASPAGQMLAVNWSWGSAGWTGVLVLLRRRFSELAWFLAAQALATLGVQAWDGLSRTDLAGFLAVLAWSTGAQVAVAAGVRAMDVTAGHAAKATEREHAARERAATAQIIQAARQARWLALEESAVPLIAELAAGTANPGDEQVRVRCAVQAARLRRLLAEGDEVAGSLVHELHASADVAERRGVAIEIETAGALPQVPGPARRVITDAAIAILTAARTQARITLATVAAGIAVSFVADTGGVVRLPVAGEGVAIEQQQDEGMLWAEARWNNR